MRNLTLLAFVVASVSVSACRGSTGDDTVSPDSNGNGNDVKIQDIQNDAMPNGTEVKVKGVVVTAIDNYGGKKGDFWVEEPGGGEFSGVHVYGAPLDQVAALHVGDVVDIAGAVKDDFHYNGNNGSGGFEDGYAITELKPVEGGTMSVTATGGQMTITPDVVDALAIGQMSDYVARDAEWEKWEGVLVKVTNVAAASDDDCVGSACNDDTLHSFDITGDVIVESALGPMPSTAVKRGDCLGSVTGVVDYFFDYQILPRDIDGDGTTEDLVTNGGTCPTENQSATCGDGMDNDGDGFSDCDDNDCLVAAASCSTTMTIQAIQTATTVPTGGVKLEGVCVAALSRAVQMPSKRFNMWVQTSTGTATLNNGIFILGPGTDLSAFTAGKKVDIIGKVKEFNDSANTGTGTLTEIQAASVTLATGTCTPTAILDQSVANLSMDANGEPAESVLVELKNVDIKTVGTDQNFHVGSLEQGSGTAAVTFKFDDDSFRIPEGTNGGDPVNTCYSSITGIWSYQVYDNVWYFLPTAAGTKAASMTPCQ